MTQIPFGPKHDPWEPELNRRQGLHLLTSVEITVTNRCNMRCVHCAVGETLMIADPERVSLDLLFRRLDEASRLKTLSITGGEPSESRSTLTEVVLPILQYAHRRGIKTQINTNLTYDLARYLLIAPYVDVFHISWNYRDVADYHRIAWGHGRQHVPIASSVVLYQRIIDNTRALTAAGYFVSAESMINLETAPYLGELNRFIASMGCQRHEIHPMYPVDWAADLPVVSLDQYRAAVNRLLDERDPDLWVLFGTFPFVACSALAADRALLKRIGGAPSVQIRNCPDGRNRVNINLFSGDIFVTDFADVPPLGNLASDRLDDVLERWQVHEVFAPFNCYCSEAACTGPNLIVARTWFPGVDFRERKALV